MRDASDIETDLVPILASAHGQQRRLERKIAMKDLQAAVKHGKKELSPLLGPNGERRWMYTFAGVVFVTDYHSVQEITSWTLPGWGVEVEKALITPEMLQQHQDAVERIQQDKSLWTSHTVVVVDQSGSMRNTDTEEGISRSDMVWLSLALKVVGETLKTGQRKSTDVFSLLSMKEDAEILLYHQPFDWILYNKLIDFLREERPMGHGNYFPALKRAKSLLMSNRYGGCALMLMFLSDGRPSDKFKKGEVSSMQTHSDNVRKQIGKLARNIGARLTVGAIPLGETDAEFLTLKALVEGAKEYGSRGYFQPASLSAATVSRTMSSLSSTVTSTMVEMTDVTGKRLRQCRTFRKEPLSKVGGLVLNNEFLMVPWKQEVITRGGEKSFGGRRKKKVNSSIVRTRWHPRNGWRPVRPKHVFFAEDAIGVAFKRAWFGEGAERLVKEFREVDANNIFVGPRMVAKDTKYIRTQDEDGVDTSKDEKAFHKVFCKTQLKAQRYANKFNDKLKKLPAVDVSRCPQIEFLDCSVYMIDLPEEDGGRQGYLVERMLDIKKFKYRKWNDNQGRIGDVLDDVILEEEEEEEEEELDEDFSSELSSLASSVESGDDGCGNNEDTFFTWDDIPQAFSCFTHWVSDRKFLICDLQGVLNTDRSPPTFELTDPVIHHRSSTKAETKHGRTDKGLDGIHSFFKTHTCSNLCRMMQSRVVVVDPNAPTSVAAERTREDEVEVAGEDEEDDETDESR